MHALVYQLSIHITLLIIIICQHVFTLPVADPLERAMSLHAAIIASVQHTLAVALSYIQCGWATQVGVR